MIDSDVQSSSIALSNLNKTESSELIETEPGCSNDISNATNSTNNKSFDHKKYSIENYEKRFLNSLKQLNAPKWFSMNVSSSSSINTNTNQSNSNKNIYTKKHDSINSSCNDTNSKSITKTNTENPIVSAHKLKYERIKQRYRQQQHQLQTQNQAQNSNDELLNKTQVKIRETNLNKSTRSLTNSIHYNNRIYDEDENDENPANSSAKRDENTYSKSAYSLNNDSQYLSSYASTLNNDLIKRSQSSYNNTNKSNNSILDGQESTIMNSVKQRPLWLSYSALQNKSSSTIYSFTSTGSNWYKPKSLQLPTNLIKNEENAAGNLLLEIFFFPMIIINIWFRINQFYFNIF